MKTVIISNLYPLPWEANRGLFNFQQFSRLAEHRELEILVPVAIGAWLRHAGLRNAITQGNVRYTWYLYTPGFGRSLYGLFMTLSLLLNSGLWLRRGRYSVLFASWAFPDGYAGRWLARLFGLRFYLKVHGSDINVLAARGLRRRFIRHSCEAARTVVSVSEALRERIDKMCRAGARVRVIYNGVDRARFFPGDQRMDHVVYIGNLKREKGVYELISAFAAITSDTPDLKLVVIGGGEEAAGVEAAAHESGVAERISLMGALPHEQVAQYLRDARLLVLPSYNEGVPNVILEAMASGTPAVATRVGGIPEVVVSGETGFLCQPRDPVALGAAIERALGHAWDRDLIVSHAARFDWDANAMELHRVLA